MPLHHLPLSNLVGSRSTTSTPAVEDLTVNVLTPYCRNPHERGNFRWPHGGPRKGRTGWGHHLVRGNLYAIRTDGVRDLRNRALIATLPQRPGDRAISGSIGFGVRELHLVRVQEGRNVALGGFPAEFPVECGD
jgi:hypothetical protein